MGSIFSTETNEDNLNKHVIFIYRKWMNSFYYCDEQPVESIHRLMQTLCISDKRHIKNHMENNITRIRSPIDFVICKIINLLTKRERIFCLRPWSYYKIRESSIHDEFVLSDDMIENIAMSDNHVFWNVLKIINNLPGVNIHDLQDTSFWTRMFILTGDSKLLYRYALKNKTSLEKFESFRDKYSSIAESFIYTSSSETE